MRVAVVGANGFIGAPLVTALSEAGHDAFRILRGDPYDFQGCEVVYNCAGVSGGGAFLQADPLAMVGPNVRIALDVFDAAKRDGVQHVIAMSSTTGYPDMPYAVRESEYFDGDVAPMYRNPGETRRFIERLAGMYPFDTTFIRVAGAYGRGDKYDPANSHVIGATIRKVAERHDPLICWGDGNDERDAVHIDDLVRALVLALGWRGKGAVNIGVGACMSINAMIDVLCRHAGYAPKVLHDMTKPRMIPKRLLDVTKAATLGWSASVPMAEGLCRALDEYAGR